MIEEKLPREIFLLEIERFLGMIEGRKQALGELLARGSILPRSMPRVTSRVLYSTKGFALMEIPLHGIDTKEFPEFYFLTVLRAILQISFRFLSLNVY